MLKWQTMCGLNRRAATPWFFVPRLLAGILLAAVPWFGATRAAPSQNTLVALSNGISFYERPAASIVKSEDAQRAWARLAPQIMAMNQGRITSGVLFAHFYRVGKPDERTAEWVLAAVERNGQRETAELLRFRFLDMAPIATYRQSMMQAPAIDQQRAASILKTLPLYPDHSTGRGVLERVGEFFFFVSPATDFGGTQVLVRKGGQLIFAATTVHDGLGRLLFPNAGEHRN